MRMFGRLTVVRDLNPDLTSAEVTAHLAALVARGIATR